MLFFYFYNLLLSKGENNEILPLVVARKALPFKAVMNF